MTELIDRNVHLIIPETLKKFQEKFDAVCEKPPHFANRVFSSCIMLSNVGALCDAFRGIVDGATRDEKLTLIKAHPDLGAKLNPKVLEAASICEQKGAGFHSLPQIDLNKLRGLNRAYKENFGFPFIFAVRAADPAEGPVPEQVLASIARRITNDEDKERGTALDQIHHIAAYRISDIARQDME